MNDDKFHLIRPSDWKLTEPAVTVNDILSVMQRFSERVEIPCMITVTYSKRFEMVRFHFSFPNSDQTDQQFGEDVILEKAMIDFMHENGEDEHLTRQLIKDMIKGYKINVIKEE